jgi:hypothetical protein
MQLRIEPGEVRYMVFYEDRHSNVPLVRTLRFSHSARSQDGVDLLIFLELFGTLDREKTFVRLADADSLLDGDGLLRTLEECFSGRTSGSK